MLDVASAIEDLVRDAVEDRGFELVHVTFNPRSSSPLLRIYIDRPGGVDVDDCAEISRQVSVLLDVEDLIESKYILEVSSPGIERPLFKEADYVRFAGHKVRLETTGKIEGRRKFAGVIQKFAEGNVTLRGDDQLFLIPFSVIKKAHLVHDFASELQTRRTHK